GRKSSNTNRHRAERKACGSGEIASVQRRGFGLRRGDRRANVVDALQAEIFEASSAGARHDSVLLRAWGCFASGFFERAGRLSQHRIELLEPSRVVFRSGESVESCGWTRGTPMRWKACVALLGAVACTWMVACDGKSDPKAEAPPPVKIEK